MEEEVSEEGRETEDEGEGETERVAEGEGEGETEEEMRVAGVWGEGMVGVEALQGREVDWTVGVETMAGEGVTQGDEEMEAVAWEEVEVVVGVGNSEAGAWEVDLA